MNETEKISSAADVEWQRYEYVNENPTGYDSTSEVSD
jgi:hypothetical protein